MEAAHLMIRMGKKKYLSFLPLPHMYNIIYSEIAFCANDNASHCRGSSPARCVPRTSPTATTSFFHYSNTSKSDMGFHPSPHS